MSYAKRVKQRCNAVDRIFYDAIISNGDVAQMGERSVRNAEVRGSIPLISTRFLSFFC